MIINEEIYGNIATVYHRSQTPPDKFKEILEKNEQKSGIGAGNLYGPGLYTVFTKSSNNKWYGKYLYKIIEAKSKVKRPRPYTYNMMC